MNSRKARILFLCTGNSCRSQMAEGYAKHFGKDKLEVQSAGIEAHGKNPRALSIMAEDGLDISNQESTIVTEDMLNWADLLISVCGHADENCPIVEIPSHRLHWPLDDPAKAEGSEEEITAEFRRVRDDVKKRVEDLINNIKLYLEP